MGIYFNILLLWSMQFIGILIRVKLNGVLLQSRSTTVCYIKKYIEPGGNIALFVLEDYFILLLCY